MAQFDVHGIAGSGDLVLDCQADLLSHLSTRLVVPLLPLDQAPTPAKRLNPVFEIGGRSHVMVTQYAAAVTLRELGPRVTSLAGQHHEIIDALDVLLTGV